VYLLPVSVERGEHAEQLLHDGASVIARTPDRQRVEIAVLVDAAGDTSVHLALLRAIRAGRSHQGREGRIVASSSTALRDMFETESPPLEPQLMAVEQSNSAVKFGDQLFMKLIRRPATDINPEVEMGRFLTRRGFQHSPAVRRCPW
jgi:maltose alpha-D-glucosyltransferase / alpha-amylase